MELFFLAALSAASNGAGSASGVTQANSLPPSADTAGGESFVWGSYEGPEGSRRYKLYVPSKGSSPKRLLVMLHGCTQDPDDFARGTRMNAVAGAQGFAVLYPEQPATANPLKCWNWFAASHQKRGQGEPGLLASMIQKVVAEQKIDPSKVYVAGISAGGAMAAILGATYPELASGLAIHSGIAYGLATDVSQALGAMRTPKGDGQALGKLVRDAMGERRKMLPVFIIQGEGDASVNKTNADLLAMQWAFANGYTGDASQVSRDVSDHVPGLWTTTYTTDKHRVLSRSFVIKELGHAWSGGSKEGTFTNPATLDASSAVVEFFLSLEKKPK